MNALCQINTSSKAHVAEQVDTDGDFSSTRMFPDVSFDSESSKENQLDIRYVPRNDRKQMNDGCKLTWSFLTPISGKV